MKIAYSGINIDEGKVKYKDTLLEGLVEKFQPKKVSPYYFEFVKGDYKQADAIVIDIERILDLLILDMEKAETRMENSKNPAEKEIFKKCLSNLEEQKPVCDMVMTDNERAAVNALGLLSMKPTVVFKDTDMDVNDICTKVMDKAGVMFFYTAGKQEVHAWLVKKGANAVTCAGKIHSDLARGFIKADVVSYDDLMSVHNMQEARSKNLVKLVERDYVVTERSVLEIRFNV